MRLQLVASCSPDHFHAKKKFLKASCCKTLQVCFNHISLVQINQTMPGRDLSEYAETNVFHQSVNIPRSFYKYLILFRCIALKRNIWQDFMQLTHGKLGHNSKKRSLEKFLLFWIKKSLLVQAQAFKVACQDCKI